MLQSVLLIEKCYHRTVLYTKLAQCIIHNVHLFIHLRIRRVHHMNNDIRILRFLQRTFKRFHQMVWKLPYKAYRIRKQDLLSIIQRQRPRRCVQRGKQHGIFQNPRIRQGILYTALSRGGIAHKRSYFHARLSALGPDQFPVFFHISQVPFQSADSLPDQPAVHLQLFFTRTSCPDAAAQTGKGSSKPGQTGSAVP